MNVKMAAAQMKFLNACSNFIIARMANVVASLRLGLLRMREQMAKLKQETSIQEELVNSYSQLTENMKTVNGTKK